MGGSVPEFSLVVTLITAGKLATLMILTFQKHEEIMVSWETATLLYLYQCKEWRPANQQLNN